MGSSSGLIIAFVVAVWAAYFVPLVLRRYDEASKNASVETSGLLSRVIARPAAAAEIADPATVEAPVQTHVEITAEAAARPARTTTSGAARLAASRRRRTLLTLLALTAIVGALAGFSIIGAYWVAAPVILVATWLIACRLQVRNELGLARVAAPSFHRIGKINRTSKIGKINRTSKIGKINRTSKIGKINRTSKIGKINRTSRASRAKVAVVDEEDTIIVSGQFEDINPGRKNMMEDLRLDPTALDDQIVIAVPSVSTTGEALWDPLPVTLPTYVTKPRAGRTVRTIEFGQAGAWTSGHIEGEDTELPLGAEGSDERRRAVGH